MLYVKLVVLIFFFFFFNDTATTEIYTLSLHDALPICPLPRCRRGCSHTWPTRSRRSAVTPRRCGPRSSASLRRSTRSEEHTSELQSRQYLVCRLLLEKKKKNNNIDQLTSVSKRCI